MRTDTLTAIAALAALGTACLHNLETRWPGPSLALSAKFVSKFKRQEQGQDQGKIPVFFGALQNTSTPMYACFAGGSENKVPQSFEAKQVVDLQDESVDPNLVLGVTVYFPQVSQNEVIMYDTSTSPKLASACLGFVEQMGMQVRDVVLSHKHQDHTAGVDARQLDAIPVVAQENTKTDLAQGNGRLPDKTFRQEASIGSGNNALDLLHFNAHTDDGTAACMGNLCLMGDECEDNIPFIAEPERVLNQAQNLQQTIQTLESKSVDKVCPAHGNGDTIFEGCFGLDLCKSNLKYLQLISSDTRNTCAQTLQQLAPKIGRRERDITQAYASIHEENCRALTNIDQE
ncbi:hypothetical protein CDD81_5297 [Ophiocordyceps australis]|uniref:Metallo-beta-lactamase domain-containing protein n=1 Tax=Ophiocordyceps australis TaxID=1399860 RepID=A0A2C5YBR7_9HYPO|nr:hypothetical protein CDD81_5297 [Ophiocordyceps australis]